MAEFSTVPKNRIAEYARERYAEMYGDAPQSAPPQKNGRAALQAIGLASALRFEFRDQEYDLLPVSFADGIRLVEAREAIERIGARDAREGFELDTAEGYIAALRTVVGLTRNYVRPVAGPAYRFFWNRGWVPNPFRSATEAELGTLLGFFLGCRTISSVRRPGAR